MNDLVVLCLAVSLLVTSFGTGMLALRDGPTRDRFHGGWVFAFHLVFACGGFLACLMSNLVVLCLAALSLVTAYVTCVTSMSTLRDVGRFHGGWVFAFHLTFACGVFLACLTNLLR